MVSAGLKEVQSGWRMQIKCLLAFESQESKDQVTLFFLFMWCSLSYLLSNLHNNHEAVPIRQPFSCKWRDRNPFSHLLITASLEKMQKLSNEIILQYVPTLPFELNTQKTKRKEKQKTKEKKNKTKNTGGVNVFKPCGWKLGDFLAQSKQRPPVCIAPSHHFSPTLCSSSCMWQRRKGPALPFLRLELLWKCRNLPATTGWPARSHQQWEEIPHTPLTFKHFLWSLLLRPVCFLLILKSRANLLLPFLVLAWSDLLSHLWRFPAVLINFQVTQLLSWDKWVRAFQQDGSLCWAGHSVQYLLTFSIIHYGQKSTRNHW